MPTGYTYPVIEGKITTAQEFAQLCARAFMWNMRDESMDSPLRMPERYDSYYAEEIPKALKELADWDASTEEEKYAQWSDYAEATEKRANEAEAEAEKNLNLLNDLWIQVDAIQVPETHKEFRKYMLSQLESTIEQDGNFNSKWYQVIPYVEWVDTQRSQLLRRIALYTEEMAKAEERYQKSVAWVNTLSSIYGLDIK